MKKLLVVAVGLAFAVPCLAQPAQPPKPGPEVQKLAYFVGMWKVEGEAKPSSFGPAGKFSGTQACEWFVGGFQVVCRAEVAGPGGKIAELAILAYDAEAKAYAYYGITNAGTISTSKGTVAGNTWTWLSDWKAVGKLRFTEVQESPTARAIKVEHSVAGGPWTVIEEGKASKVK